MADAAEAAKVKDPGGYASSANAKLLAAIYKIAFEQIPTDPTDARYRMGNAVGAAYRHWFREKFGNARFRIFFRFDTKAKIIVYAWVNDANTLRTYGSSTDAYAVFAKMLKAGNPPDQWTALVAACSDQGVMERTKAALAKK